jgi:hypothetical protein
MLEYNEKIVKAEFLKSKDHLKYFVFLFISLDNCSKLFRACLLRHPNCMGVV